MVFDNENLFKNIEELENIKELENFKETEEQIEDKELEKREKEKIQRQKDIIEFIIYIILSLILLYCIAELIIKNNKINKNGILVGGAGPLAAIGMAMKGAVKGIKSVGSLAAKAAGKIGKGLKYGAKKFGQGLKYAAVKTGQGLKYTAKTVGKGLFSGSSSSSSYRNTSLSGSIYRSSYSNSLKDIQNKGGSKLLLMIVIGGLICFFGIIIPSLLPILILFVILFICKSFAIEQYEEIMK